MAEDIGLEFFGQKMYWPKTAGACVAACVMTALAFGGVVLIFRIILVEAKTANIQSVGEQIKNNVGTHAATYAGDGKSDGRIVQTIYRFWTPNKNTKFDLTPPGEVPEKTKIKDCYWVDDNERQIADFRKILTSFDIVGLSYYEAWGEASTPLKRGYFWEITTEVDHPITRQDFLKIYSKFWKRDVGIYLEEYHLPPVHGDLLDGG
jgi:hypothetical protein